MRMSIFFIHFQDNIHGLHFLILVCIYRILFIYILIFHTLICIYKLQNAMDGRFVLLAMSERALSNDFQQMRFFQKQSCVKYLNLQNDIHQTFVLTISHFPLKLEVVFIGKQNLYNCEDEFFLKNKLMTNAYNLFKFPKLLALCNFKFQNFGTFNSSFLKISTI